MTGRGFKYRTRLIIFFVLSIAVVLLTAVYSNISSQLMIQSMTDVMTSSQELTSVYAEVHDIQQNLEEYLTTGSSDSLLKFYNHSSSISDKLSVLSRSKAYTERGIRIKNVINMTEHYLNTLDHTINEKRWRNIDGYKTGYTKSLKEYGYIGSYIQETMSSDLSSSADQFIRLMESARSTGIVNNLLIVTTMLIVTTIIVIFSYEITRPISKLVSYSKQISEGNYDILVESDGTSSEIDLLYQAFGAMTTSIKKYVNELKEKQRLETTLNQEKLLNLRMSDSLHEAELAALQAQVNPHFIFNTINIGSKIAMLQGDDITCSYLENAADIFRYNLKGLDYNATLSEEINNAIAYMNLLQTRFGESFNFIVDSEEKPQLQNFILPRMTLQPLVENAYIHGVSKQDYGGQILLSARIHGDTVVIVISNTGSDISSATIDLILKRGLKSERKVRREGHTTGIGTDNVLQRLRLFFNTDNVMSIHCDGHMTHFTLTLPINHPDWSETNVPSINHR